MSCTGSRYTLPTTGRVIAMTNGIVSLSLGGLVEPIVNEVLLTANNQIINQSSDKLNLSLTLSSGLFSGSVQVPGTSRSLSFKGALLQDEAAGFGYFLGTNQSGHVYLGTPQ